MLLGGSSGIGGTAILIKSALIDYAEAAVVVVAGMNALDSLGQQGNDIAIAADIVVVGALAIFGFATGYQVLHAERAVAFVGHAVDDQQLHGVVFQGFHFLTEITESTEIVLLEQVRAAGLHGDRTGNASDYGSEELEDFGDIAPVDFNHRVLF